MTNTVLTFNMHAYVAAKGLRGFRTDSQVAEAAGITRSRLSQILQGAVPPEELRDRLAKALGGQARDIWVKVELPEARGRR